MSDYGVSNKVDGNPWSATEHNAMKVALNSKQDRSNMVNNLGTPNNTTYPTTSAVSQAISTGLDATNNFKFRGFLEAASDIDSKIENGFYILPENVSPAHASYPFSGGPYAHGGDLLVYNKGNVINQKMSFNGDNGSSPPRLFMRTSNDAGASFEGWYELATVEYVNTAVNGLPPGVPTITSSVGIDISDPATSANDLHGFVSFINNTGSDLPAGVNIIITFQYPRTGLNCIITSPLIEADEIPVVSPYGFPSNTSATIRIRTGIPDGSGGSFFYHIS